MKRKRHSISSCTLVETFFFYSWWFLSHLPDSPRSHFRTTQDREFTLRVRQDRSLSSYWLCGLAQRTADVLRSSCPISVMEAAGKHYKLYDDVGRLTSLGTVCTVPMVFLEHQNIYIFSFHLTSDEAMSVKGKCFSM